EALEPARDAEVDGLVIAGLEMHAGHVFGRAPVAAPHRGVVEHVERRAYAYALAPTLHQHEVLRHGPADAMEEVARQVRGRAVRAIRALVAAIEEVPVLGRDLGAQAARERDACLAELAPVLAHLLALVVVERGQKVIEARIAGID